MRPPHTSPFGSRRDAGYALLAAVTAVAAFAYIAFEVMAAGQGDVAIVGARVRQASLAAAADAGIYLALRGLGTEDQADRWAIDGRPRQEAFSDYRLTIVVEDERGKAPLAGLNDVQARSMFQWAGATGSRLDDLVDEFRDWQADDPYFHSAAEAAAIAAAPPVRHGPFATVGELAALKDMDVGLFNRIAPSVTTFFEESGPFQTNTASPLAIATMMAQAAPGGDFVLPRVGAPVEQISQGDDNLIGRTLTVRVLAQARDGSQTHRMAIVELTGDTKDPFWIRYVE
jgi:type II secretory pathway component PulK